MNIDFEALREYMLDYFGSGSTFNPALLLIVSKVENASDIELLDIAKRNGINIDRFRIKIYTK